MTAADITATDRLFGERLRAVRRARGLTGPALAAKAGLPEQAVYRIEGVRGPATRRATVGEAAALAAALRVDLAQLLTADEMRVPLPAARELVMAR